MMAVKGGDIMELPDFEEFMEFAKSIDTNPDEMHLDVFELESWPPTQEQLSAMLAKVQSDAITFSLRRSLRFLAAYHLWLQTLLSDAETTDHS